MTKKLKAGVLGGGLILAAAAAPRVFAGSHHGIPDRDASLSAQVSLIFLTQAVQRG